VALFVGVRGRAVQAVAFNDQDQQIVLAIDRILGR
jgi:hypothetical protein